MGHKKKYLNIFYMLSLVVACVICFGNSSVKAISDEDFIDFITSVKQVSNYQNFTLDNNIMLTNIKAEITLADYPYIWTIFANNRIYMYGVNTSDTKLGAYSGSFYKNSENSITQFFITINNSGTVSTPYYVNKGTGTQSLYGSWSDSQGLCSNFMFYNSNWIDETYAQYHNFEKTDSIVISTPLTQVHQGSYVGDKQQCNVMLTGNYEIDMFDFFIQKNINNEWVNVTGSIDYYELWDEENEQLYSNPYYVFWHSFSYLSPGQYRFMATTTGGVENPFSTVSNEFTMYAYNAISSGTATGTIDSNGNVDIDINVDNGEAVSGIIDFLNDDINTSEDDIKNNFPQVEVDDPTSDFFTWFFEQIKLCFTVDTAQYLTFSLYNKTFTINSDDYIINIPVVTNILGLGSGIFILYAIFLDIRKEIEKVKEGKFTEIGKEDISASMM